MQIALRWQTSPGHRSVERGAVLGVPGRDGPLDLVMSMSARMWPPRATWIFAVSFLMGTTCVEPRFLCDFLNALLNVSICMSSDPGLGGGILAVQPLQADRELEGKMQVVYFFITA